MTLVPELLVTTLDASLAFWSDRLGFTVRYGREEEGFVLLDRGPGVSVMLEERGRAPRTWETGPLDPPLGRGINLEITVEAIDPLLAAFEGLPLFVAPEERWYRAGEVELGVRQFCVQDPDGYLVRLAESLGERPAPS